MGNPQEPRGAADRPREWAPSFEKGRWLSHGGRGGVGPLDASRSMTNIQVAVDGGSRGWACPQDPGHWDSWGASG